MPKMMRTRTLWEYGEDAFHAQVCPSPALYRQHFGAHHRPRHPYNFVRVSFWFRWWLLFCTSHRACWSEHKYIDITLIFFASDYSMLLLVTLFLFTFFLSVIINFTDWATLHNLVRTNTFVSTSEHPVKLRHIMNVLAMIWLLALTVSRAVLTYHAVFSKAKIIHRLVHRLLNLLPITPPLNEFIDILHHSVYNSISSSSLHE